MIHLSTNYYTLIGSLPALPQSFEQAERVPISPLKLDERLKMLVPRDARVVEKMSDFLVWERQPLERSDAEVVARYENLLVEVDDRFAQELIRNTIAARTVLAGLRCRRLQRDPPQGVAPWAAQIARNWNHPDFRLGRQFPWILDVDRQLSGDAPFDLERSRIEIGWRQLKQLSEQYGFGFEAVLLYLMRWELVYRWTRRDADAGHAKFETLATDAMGDFAQMFA